MAEANLLTIYRYNVTIKTYVPGFADFHEGKNLTIDAAAIIIFRVEEPTDKIVLNAYKLEFVDDSTKYKLAQYIERVNNIFLYKMPDSNQFRLHL